MEKQVGKDNFFSYVRKILGSKLGAHYVTTIVFLAMVKSSYNNTHGCATLALI
jgi:hypothetical protein